MSDLRPNLFDTDFDHLVELGRSLIPKYAPEWTDHNLHDPGIMLIELLAWTAEAQMYSLARLRSDERWAYAALLGLTPRGPLPAWGMLWCAWDSDRGSATRGLVLRAGTEVTAHRVEAPKFRLCESVNLTGARLVGVESRLHDGRRLNHQAINDRPGAAYYPFGEQAEVGDRLVLDFVGPLLALDNAERREALLSFGVRVPDDGKSAPIPADRPDDVAGSAGHGRSTTNIAATLLKDGQFRYPLPVRHDDSNGFLRTGTILLDLSKVPGKLGDRFSIEFASRNAGLVGPPRILCIQPNVLPIEQAETRRRELAAWSNGLPDQTLALEETGIRFSKSQPGPGVRFIPKKGAEEWKCTEDLSTANPEDAVFSFDASTRQLRFGNGVNGLIPPIEAALQVEYELTEGVAGNLPAGLEWTVKGHRGFVASNLDPTAGGEAALELSEVRRLARERVRKVHAIVTSADLELAALALADVHVVRAHALCAPDLGVHHSALISTRTLVALRARPAIDASASPAESPRWLAEVQRQLAGRLPLGERLHVIAPDYFPFSVQATLLARRGYDPDVIEAVALDVLAGCFTLVAGQPGDQLWPLGRQPTSRDVRVRLLNIDGVAKVQECSLPGLEQSLPTATPKPWTTTSLPLLRLAQCRIAVERSVRESIT